MAGRRPRFLDRWDTDELSVSECEEQVRGYKGARYKEFKKFECTRITRGGLELCPEFGRIVFEAILLL
uniref:Ribonuclease H1 N-terminal domain-containing protein n=1 Tax=Physcomitrium patens TaxID=3218 RepID=A0A2K1KL99_PHYPA|nr:hypothetical protein PHYPA_008228 [Physcomitrium patens]